MIRYYESDVYTKEEIKKMSLKKKRRLAKEKTVWAVKKVIALAEERAEEHPDWDINVDHPDEEYVYDYVKTCDEESLDGILMEESFNEESLEIALSIIDWIF